MSKQIFSINYEIPGHSDLYKDFTSKSSLMDADIVVFSPEDPGSYYEEYQGKPSYDESRSFQYKEDIQHWKKELLNCLQSGRTVFLFLGEKKYFFLKTGTKEYQAKVTINHVDQHDNYEFLPVNIGKVITAKGTNIEYTKNVLFSNFYKNFKSNLEYQVYLEDIASSTLLFTGKNKNKILGAMFKIGSGHLVVLPNLSYDEKKFIKYKTDKKGKETGSWTTEAIKFGDTLTGCLVEIDRGLTQVSTKTLPPAWVTEDCYILNEEQKIKDEIKRNNEEIKTIEQKNKLLQSKLQEEELFKDLLFEQGKPLELAVIKALEMLGFNAENFNDGELELDQVILGPEGYRYVGECEGKDNKDIDIDKFRQLLESMNADFAREEISEKAFGILFGNPQRLLNPKERTLDFTQKCKIGATREKIALVKTADLFKVSKFLKEKSDENFKKSCREAIHNGLGTVVKFPDVPVDKEI
jgi:hypothetical protein